MKLAITGATGIIGNYLVHGLHDHKLLLLGRSSKKLSELFSHLSYCEFVETDYSEENLTKQLDGVDSVIHFAAVRPINPLKTFDDYYVNIRITEQLFSACKKLSIMNFVLASTSSVYSPGKNEIPFREDGAVYPRNFYALSKIACEYLGEIYKLNVKSLRIAPVLAFGEKEGYLIRTILDRANRGDDLIIYGEGIGKREYIYVKDIVNAIKTAISKPELKGVFNIGMGESISILEFINTVAEVFSDRGSKVIQDRSKPEDRNEYLMDGKKARSILGWMPAYNMKDAIMDIKSEYQRNKI